MFIKKFLSLAVSFAPLVSFPAVSGEIAGMVVTATRNPFTKTNAVSPALSSISPDEVIQAPNNLTSLLDGLPGVAQNSQPGIYQVSSIRGVSRQRVLTLIEGMRISSDRRAGVAANFLDPELIGEVHVVRGPASTYYGSGAIGGVIEVLPAERQGLKLSSGYHSVGDETSLAALWGNPDWTFALAQREAKKAKDIDGNELNTAYEQWSAVMTKRWHGEETEWELLWLPSRGYDLGRNSTQYPDRIVTVPEEEHDLVKLSFLHQAGISSSLYFHDQFLQTETIRPANRINWVDNASLDVGGNLQKSWSQDRTENVLGVDWFSRRAVESDERELNLTTNANQLRRTLDGQMDELALFATYLHHWDTLKLQLGTRFTWQEDSNRHFGEHRDHALTALLGLNYQLTKQWSASTNISNGFRFASLTEKYFSGTTGRSAVVGNPNLDPEQSVNLDLGLGWKNESLGVQWMWFHNDIEDYIEQVEAGPDLLTYVNLTEGKISGLEMDSYWQVRTNWKLKLIATKVEGEDNNGDPLADIPATRLDLATEHRLFEDWSLALRWQHRQAKNDPGAGELKTGSAEILFLNLRYQITPTFELKLTANNLLNDRYVNSTDEISTLAAGREWGMGVVWYGI